MKIPLVKEPHLPTPIDHLKRVYPEVDWKHVVNVLSSDMRMNNLIAAEHARQPFRMQMNQILRTPDRIVQDVKI